jgi:hypothetical protein
MPLIESGSGPLQTNKKDWVFLAKISGLAALAAIVSVNIEQFDVVKGLVPEKYSAILTGIVLPLLVWLAQWLSDSRKKIETDTEDKDDGNTPLPPMVSMLFLMALLFPGESWAQVVAYQGATSEVQTNFKPYTLIRMEAKEDGKSFVWILRRLPDGFRPDSIRVNNGKELVWTGPPGFYDIDMIYTDKDGILQQLFTRVTIEGNQPAPQPPVPGPTPPSPDNPNPPQPDNPTPGPVTPLPKPFGKFGFSQVAYDEAMKIPVKERLELAVDIGDNYGSVSAAIFAGGIVDVNKAFEEIRSRNRELSSKASFATWSPWFDALGVKVQQDWLAKKLNSRSDIAEVFREVQEGVLASIGKKPE